MVVDVITIQGLLDQAAIVAIAFYSTLGSNTLHHDDTLYLTSAQFEGKTFVGL